MTFHLATSGRARPAIWFPWSNMVLWGMGLPLGLAAWIGWAFAAFELVRRRKIEHFIPVVFIGIVFLYQGTQWVKSMRYFLHIYPFLAMTAAYLLHRMWTAGRLSGAVGRITTISRAVVLGIVGLTALYAIGFTSIYTKPTLTCGRFTVDLRQRASRGRDCQ